MVDLDPSLLAKINAVVAETIKQHQGAPLTPTSAIPAIPFLELWNEWQAWASEVLPEGGTRLHSWKNCKAHSKRILPWFTKYTVDQLTPGLVDQFQDEQSKTETRWNKGAPKPTYLYALCCTVHAMLKWHVRRGRLPRNPVEGWTRVDNERYARQTYLTDDQFARFVEDAHPLFRAMATVAIRCAGLRNGEVRLLRKEEVHLDTDTIVLNSRRTKMKRTRTIPFPTEVREILVDHMKRSRGPFVFVMPSDPKCLRPPSIATLQRWLDQARERSGLVGVDGEPIVFHTMRHSGVTHLLEDGADLAAVQKAAGLSGRVLPRYSHSTPAHLNNLRQRMERRGPKTARTDAHIGVDVVGLSEKK